MKHLNSVSEMPLSGAFVIGDMHQALPRFARVTDDYGNGRDDGPGSRPGRILDQLCAPSQNFARVKIFGET